MRAAAAVGAGLIVVSVLGACVGGSSGAGGAGGTAGVGAGGAGGSDPGLPADVTFGPAIEWAVPERGYGLSSVIGYADALLDMDGDGRPDLVVFTEDSLIFGAPSDPHIRVHWNTGTSFAMAPSAWALPREIQHLGFHASNDVGCSELRAWRVRDMDGNGLADLVVTAAGGGEGTEESPCHEVPLGSPDEPHWNVHFNDGSGFATTPVRLAIPEAMVEVLAWHPWRRGRDLRDLDGDGRPDFVVSQDHDSAQVPGYGSAPHWRFFRNLGDAFDAATEWPVPEGGESGYGFRTMDGYSADISSGPFPRSPVGSQSWIVRDVTGDARPDLLVIAESTEHGPMVPGAPDALHWRLHRNTGSGFAAVADELLLPQLGNLQEMRMIGNGWGARIDLRHLDPGDFPVLVEGPESFAVPHFWTVHRLGPGGFSEAERWAMPSSPNDLAFLTPEGEGLHVCAIGATECEQRSSRWMTVDMDGDGLADLVEWMESESDPYPGEPGARHFRVYLQVAR